MGSQPVAHLVGDRLTQQVAAFARWEDAARAGDDVAIHRMRVVCRRLRALLATFRPVFDRAQTDPIRAELAWLAGVLGAARDAAVVHDRLRGLVDQEPPALVHGPVRHRLGTTFEGRGKPELRATLGSPRYADLRARLGALAADPPWTELADRPVGEVAPRLLRKDGKRVRRRARLAAGAGTDEAWHDARKAVKRLRYAAETVEPVAGGPARRLARDAKRLTATLGELQDTAMSRRELPALARAAARAGEPTFTYGLLHGRERARAEQLRARYCAWDTLDMLKSGTRRAGVAVREK
ncbi:CHAD domain-containing protein [Nocardioides sp. LMS-CY]|uniref:CHAD domain-containing protein n=1 Tax=Nocardioides sp. (strain LMS-CY) TaxID=2840457 RepID=UPI001C00819F|nr:CHAD domain-containing protein [Nocardioides sp. LMS-CY]QWF24504.1 CHAD domain-containing protein [Nocardioides sp. LMS-CY]